MTLRERGYVIEGKYATDIKMAKVVKALVSKFTLVKDKSDDERMVFTPKRSVSLSRILGIAVDLLRAGGIGFSLRAVTVDRRMETLIINTAALKRSAA